jgi:hypothetical protein
MSRLFGEWLDNGRMCSKRISRELFSTITHCVGVEELENDIILGSSIKGGDNYARI